MNTKTYRLTKIIDLLTVPIERREDCVRDLLYLLALHELAHGNQAADVELTDIVWTDDGNKNITLIDENGVDVLVLEVTE